MSRAGHHTPELIEVILAAWRGGSSYGQMSRRFALTKHIVAGIIFRNKEPGEEAVRPFRGGPVQGPRVCRLSRPGGSQALPFPMARLAKMARARCRTCQWIAAEPSADDRCKCGPPTGSSRVYCPEHEARAWCKVPRVEEAA